MTYQKFTPDWRGRLVPVDSKPCGKVLVLPRRKRGARRVRHTQPCQILAVKVSIRFLDGGPIRAHPFVYEVWKWLSERNSVFCDGTGQTCMRRSAPSAKRITMRMIGRRLTSAGGVGRG
jgi:hypothetical protein